MSFKSALQRDLDRFYKSIHNSDFNIREVTKGALSQARAKLNPWAFQRLNEVAVNSFYKEAEHFRWHGKRLLSVDGSRLILPKHQSIIDEFGSYGFGPKADSHRSMALSSMLYDTLNHLTIDAQIAPLQVSERDLLLEHLNKVSSEDMLLLDRGYPCFWLLFLLKAKSIDFCVRLKSDWWLEVKRFVESDEIDKEVKFTLPKKDQEKLSEYPDLWDNALPFRLVKVELENGETEILCTSLLDTQKHDTSEFKELYHHRWSEEEAFKLLKSRVELEDFSGKTAKAVKQDFHAKILLMTLCAAFAHPIEEKVRAEHKESENRKHAQKINRTNALAVFSDMAIPMFLKRKFNESLETFDEIVYKTREIVRPDRSEPRPKKPKKPYSMNYKRL
tara:strand:+ start:313 stop:1479 length:1167 start_codon:yes stop_codon:yes gene_type:complete